MKTKIAYFQIFMIIILLSIAANGTIINVPNDYGTIQDGINNTPNGDTLHIEANTYTGASNRNLWIPFGRNIVIRGEGPDATIIDLQSGAYSGFVFDFTQESNNTIIQDLSIRNGSKGLHLIETGPKLQNLKLVNNVRGIYYGMPFGVVRVKNCEFINNDTGIAAYGWTESTFLVDSSIFDGNDYGIFGALTVSNSEITGGFNGIGCDVGSSGPGNTILAENCNIHHVADTAIQVGYYCEMNGCKIQSNTDIIAVGYVTGGDYARLYLNDCLIDNNGNGIYINGDNATLIMDGCRYSGNGDQINYTGNNIGEVSILDCYFYGNDTRSLNLYVGTPSITIGYSVIATGGAYSGIIVESTWGDINIYSNTITNYPSYGIYVFGTGDYMHIDSNIVTGCAVGINLDASAPNQSIACNDVYNNSSSNYSGVIGDQTGINGNISVVPQFCSFPGGDFHLQATSPCAPTNNTCNSLIGGQGVGCNELQPLIITGYSPLINMTVTDPNGYIVGRDASGTLTQTLIPSNYVDGPLTDVITVPYPITGTYTIDVIAQSYAAMRYNYSLGIRIDGTNEAMMATNAPVPETDETDSYDYVVEEDWHFINGDANRDNKVNILDAVYIINYKYKEGPDPDPLVIADVDDCQKPYKIDILDVVYLINFKYKEGPKPCLILE